MSTFATKAPDLSSASKNGPYPNSITKGSLTEDPTQRISSLYRKYPDTPIARIIEDLEERNFGILKRRLNEKRIEGAAIGIITTADDGVLLTDRKATPPFGWSNPGGKVAFKERFRRALMREIREEAGVDTVIEQKPLVIEFKTYLAPSGDELELCLVTFRGRVVGGQVPHTTKLAEKEGLTVRVFNERLPRDMVPEDKEKVLRYGRLKYID